uniref:Plant heme peroxidase family profile domain-containing protein n=1 Tax=Araucaria cunninghamii TaxID=56994 RepID=A0A0D6R8I7_ARACU
MEIMAVPLQLRLQPRSSTSRRLFFIPTRCNATQDTVCYQNVKASYAERGNCSRRDIMLGFGTSAGLAVMWNLSPLLKVANAADLIQRRQRGEFLGVIKDSLKAAIQAHPDLVPSIMQLALNDAVTYDKETKTGGANGSIRLSSEIGRPENEGLLTAMKLLEDVKKEIDALSKGGPLSYADLIQLAGQSATKSTFLNAAIRKAGGNEQKGQTLYTAYGSSGQWGLFEKQFGRTDAEESDPEGRVPKWEQASVAEMRRKFSDIGLGPRQLAVMSAFLGPDQAATEAKLALDPEVARWVDKYQRSRETVSQTDYEVDLITTFTKLSCLGQNINYEAYTYSPNKIDIRKLKL